MEVILQANAAAAAGLVARIIAQELRANPRLVLGLATGCTMEAVYAHLVRLHRDEGLDFSACRTFNLDEYVGLPSSDRNSYRHYMNHHLFHQVNIEMANTHLPDGMAADLPAECARYEQLIADCGGVDLQLLGIGRNGHLGFNEPFSAFNSRTRVEHLSPATRAQNSPLFQAPDTMPHHAITMGMATILDARHCLLLATGDEKAEIVARAIEGPATSLVPASALQTHPRCTCVLDEASATALKYADHYRKNLSVRANGALHAMPVFDRIIR